MSTGPIPVGSGDADLADIAAIADVQGDIIVRGAAGWERLAKSSTATDVLTAGASQPAWAAASGGGGGGGGVPNLSPVTKIGSYNRSVVDSNFHAGVAYLTNLNRLVWSACWLAESITIDRLAISMQTPGGAGAVLRLGAWGAGADGQPGALIVDAGTVAADSGGIKEATVSAVLPAGRVWFGLVPQVDTCAVHGGPTNMTSIFTSYPAAYEGEQLFYKSGVSGALPDPASPDAYGGTWPNADVVFMFRRSA